MKLSPPRFIPARPIQCPVQTHPKLMFSEWHGEKLVIDKVLWVVGLMKDSGLCVNSPRLHLHFKREI